MLNRKLRVAIVCMSLFSIIIICVDSIAGQTPTSTPPVFSCSSVKYDNYFDLDGDRTQLLKETTEANNRIKFIKENLPKLKKIETELKRIDDLKKLPTKTDEQEKEIADFDQYSRPFLEDTINKDFQDQTSQQLESELAKLETETPLKAQRLQCIDGVIKKWYSPDASFKFWMSLIFAILILLVIVGFFWTALNDEKVRQAVFAGQVGLQFIALFSIVIAIILFGITGILEAKELAALLGSLAGYILGRTMSNQRSNHEGDGSVRGGDNSGGGFASKIASIKITPSSVSLDTTKTSEKLKATVRDASGNELEPPAGTPDLQWKSSNTAVATVDSKGIVQRVSTGEADISVEFNGVKSQNCKVTCA